MFVPHQYDAIGSGSQIPPDGPSLESLLKKENSFHGVKFMLERTIDNPKLISMDFSIDLFHSCLPMLSELVIDLGDFHGYSTGWDRVVREDIRRRRFPVNLYLAKVTIAPLSKFTNLRHLTIHFLIVHLQLLRERQARQAAFELYKSLESRKQGVRLDQLDVVFYTWACNIYGYNGTLSEVKVSVTITVRPLQKPKGDRRYSVACNNSHCGKLLDRRKKAEKLYGPNAWIYRLGPHAWACEHGETSRLVAMLSEVGVKIALWPAIFVKDKEKRKTLAKWPFEVDTREYQKPRRRLPWFYT